MRTLAEGFIEVSGGKVYYVTSGGGPGTPLLVLHGGPGFSHDPMRALDPLGSDRQVIYYDQLGSGRSDRPDDLSLWRTGRFIEELGQVREALGLDQVHLLGHSWGTMLGASYLLDADPQGVQSVIFSSPCLSAPRWAADQERYKQRLPEDLQETIRRCEAEGNTDSPEFEEAMMAYYHRHLCRLDPWPPSLEASMETANMDVYVTMWGPSEFTPTGTLKTFDVTPRLHELSLPALFLCGHFDEASPPTTRYYSSLIDGAEFHEFAQSSHMGFLEQTDEYLGVVRSFLNSVEEESQ